MIADRNIIADLFTDNVFDTPKRGSAPKKQTASSGKANSSNKARMMKKLEDELFGEFDEKDWFQYFVMKAGENDVRYLVRNYAKDYAIIRSILNELSWVDLKGMIDFVWDSPQDIVEKQTMGVWVLSKGWINTIYQNSLLWKDGKYKPKSAPTHNREWIAEASVKSSGLQYGKPIRDEEEREAPKKRSKVRIGIGLDN